MPMNRPRRRKPPPGRLLSQQDKEDSFIFGNWLGSYMDRSKSARMVKSCTAGTRTITQQTTRNTHAACRRDGCCVYHSLTLQQRPQRQPVQVPARSAHEQSFECVRQLILAGKRQSLLRAACTHRSVVNSTVNETADGQCFWNSPCR